MDRAKILIMKYLYLILLLSFFSCTRPVKEVNPDPLVIKEETVVLPPHFLGWKHEVYNPDRGRVTVRIDNYTDSVKTFLVHIEEKH